MKTYLIRITRWEYIPFLWVFRTKVYYTGYVTVMCCPEQIIGMVDIEIWDKYKTANYEIENVFVL